MIPGHQSAHSVANANSFAGVPPFYQGYSGEFFQPNQIPILPNSNFRELHAGRAHGMGGLGSQAANIGYARGATNMSSNSMLSNYNWQLSTLNDTYDYYVPGFKY